MAIRLLRLGPGATVQDLGRPGRMRDGLPPGGALVPELLVAANRALGNDDGAAALELPINGARVRTEFTTTVSLDGEVLELTAGEERDVRPSGFTARYLALPGGIDVPLVLGGRGTLVVAGLGGFEGRMVRAGDLLRAALGAPRTRSPQVVTFAREAPVRVVLGPDVFDPSDLDTLCGAPFVVSPALDRTGTRLDGFRLGARPADRRLAVPLVRGAIQVTADGTPIVLGPDHPTTGGYPVAACVVSADLGLFASRRPGQVVQFVRA